MREFLDKERPDLHVALIVDRTIPLTN